MKEKRKLLYHLVLLLATFILGLILWLSLILPYSEVNDNFTEIPGYVTHSELYNFTYPLNLLPGNDYGLLVNNSFNFSILNLGCSEQTFLLVLIHSAPGNFQKRNVIRSTWGNRTKKIKIFYVMGKALLDIQNKILHENQINKDIIQGNFKDVYRNLTLKHIMSLKYATYHCPQAKYILKTDDDVFVNMPLMQNFVNFDLSPFGTSNLLFCSVRKSVSVLRTYRSKWRVGFEEYPCRTYPTYCPGWVILYSPDVVFKLYKSAQNTANLFWIDDVHVTGILAAKNNISHTDSTNLIISKRDQHSLVEKKVFPAKPFLFGRPDLEADEIKSLWSGVSAHKVPKSALGV
ncbi:unnamed protein product [Ceutorhynchus assimilis]|uniref:Hexosyltransferase n=1 Tax=Ceutorhynchus assimilis TaxID=467358 RepID=A0A9N9QJX3_9CUCU|nr:unnamed protein product [Ceutorhynchus assimilis]